LRLHSGFNSCRLDDPENLSAMASSTVTPPKAMHRGSPLSSQPRPQE
jgi:hypothetical protein